MIEGIHQQWFDNLGVDINWKILELDTYYNLVYQEKPQMWIGGWVADYPDPDNFLRVNDAVRLVGWRDETYQRLVQDARETTDQQSRIEMYYQADKLLIESAALMPFYYLRQHFLIKPWVKRLPTSAAEWWYWKDAVIEAQD